MHTHYPYQELGRANHGWLDARHHFSFASYYNPKRMGFGTLRVINDDIIKAGRGFDTHSHRDMEIITFVREGAITHKDSNGNVGRTEAGDVQVMSAGSGVSHSEFNLETKDTNIFQIWIEPNQIGVKPRWDSHEFPDVSTTDELSLRPFFEKGRWLRSEETRFNRLNRDRRYKSIAYRCTSAIALNKQTKFREIFHDNNLTHRREQPKRA